MKTGVDIVKNSRIKALLEKKQTSFYRRMFTNNEVEYISSKNHNYKTVAGLFAAKEAISKIFGTGIGELSWKDMEILHTDNGKPYVLINEKLKSKLIILNCNDIELSISHEEEYAIAFAIGFLDKNKLELNNKSSKPRRITKAHGGRYKRNLR